MLFGDSILQGAVLGRRICPQAARPRHWEAPGPPGAVVLLAPSLPAPETQGEGPGEVTF